MVWFRRPSDFFSNFVIDGSYCFSAYIAIFMMVWASGSFLFVYSTVTSVDHILNRAPTNCTVLSAMAVSGGWNIHVTYPVPGQSENVTAHLEYTDANDIYSINQTLSCFYSTHDFRSVVQFDYGLGSGDIVALVIACIFGTIGLAGMLYGIVVTMNFLFLFFQLIFWIGGNVVNYLREKIDSIVKHIPKAQEESTSSTQKSSIYNTVTHYLTIPAKYYQEAVGGVRSWIQTGKSQPKDTYDMEEQATLIANEHSNYEDEQTTQHILSAVEVENEDRHSIGSSTLFDR